MVQDSGRYIYNGRPIESRVWSIERRHFNDLERPLTWFSMSHHSLPLNIPEIAKHTATVTMEGE